MFSGVARDFDAEPECRIEDLRAEGRNGRLELSGRIIATPEPYAIIAYNDPDGNSDYDATTWTRRWIRRIASACGLASSSPAGRNSGSWFVTSTARRPRCTIRFTPAGTERPTLLPLTVPFALRDALQAWAAGHNDEVRRLAHRRPHAPASPAVIKQWAKTLADIAGPEPEWPALRDVPATTKDISLGRVAWEKATVGWMQPARNHFPRSVDPQMPFLCLSGRYFADGLDAHAPSRYVFKLDGKWKKFTSSAGLQPGGDGSGALCVKADDRELDRLWVLRHTQSTRIDLDVSGCKFLELLVGDASDGNRGDWAVWAHLWVGDRVSEARIYYQLRRDAFASRRSVMSTIGFVSLLVSTTARTTRRRSRGEFAAGAGWRLHLPYQATHLTNQPKRRQDGNEKNGKPETNPQRDDGRGRFHHSKCR